MFRMVFRRDPPPLLPDRALVEIAEFAERVKAQAYVKGFDEGFAAGLRAAAGFCRDHGAALDAGDLEDWAAQFTATTDQLRAETW